MCVLLVLTNRMQCVHILEKLSAEQSQPGIMRPGLSLQILLSVSVVLLIGNRANGARGSDE